MRVFFPGEVVDLEDPLQIGRVRVRVFGVYDDIDDDDLPWALVMVPATSASYAQKGVSPVGLMKGSSVMVAFFDGEERQQPMVLFSSPKLRNNDANQNDVSELARGTNKNKRNPVGPEPADSYGAKYPYNKVLETESGHIVINKDGRRVDKTTGDFIQITQGDKTVYLQGKLEMESGRINLNINGNVDITASGLVKVDCVDVIINDKPYSTVLSMS